MKNGVLRGLFWQIPPLRPSDSGRDDVVSKFEQNYLNKNTQKNENLKNENEV